LHIERGNVVFPKSTTPARIKENFQLFDFQLEPGDAEKIHALDPGRGGTRWPEPRRVRLRPHLSLTRGGDRLRLPSTGAKPAIQQLTGIAPPDARPRGMSDKIGPLALLPSENAGPLLPGASESSPRTQEIVDEEVRRIVEDGHKEVVALLTEKRAQVDKLAEALLEHETLDEDEPAQPPASSTSAAALRATSRRLRSRRTGHLASRITLRLAHDAPRPQSPSGLFQVPNEGTG
jgi:hypothetical protein